MVKLRDERASPGSESHDRKSGTDGAATHERGGIWHEDVGGVPQLVEVIHHRGARVVAHPRPSALVNGSAHDDRELHASFEDQPLDRVEVWPYFLRLKACE